MVEALTRHDHNLRFEVVESLLSRVDLKDLRAWFTHSSDIVELYEEHVSVCEQLDAELRAFVQMRNDAAHGGLDTLEAKDILLRHCVLVKAVIKAMAAYFHKNLLFQRVQAGRIKRIGRVTEVFARAGAFIAQIDMGCDVQLGMNLHFVGKSYCAAQKVESLHLNDVPVDRIPAETAAIEAGVKCAFLPGRHSEIYTEVGSPHLPLTMPAGLEARTSEGQ